VPATTLTPPLSEEAKQNCYQIITICTESASHLLNGEILATTEKTKMLILLIVLILVFGFGGYRMGPGLGYYGGGGISLILLIVLILLLLRVI
jgi:uncharacterized protein DUF3309